jgi:predicted transcriptional regulator
MKCQNNIIFDILFAFLIQKSDIKILKIFTLIFFDTKKILKYINFECEKSSKVIKKNKIVIF